MDITESLAIFTGDRTKGTAPLPLTIKVPGVFGDAWLSLVMGLVMSTDWRYADNNDAFREFHDFSFAVIEGRNEILENLAPNPLEEKEAVLSLGVMSIITRNLVTNGVLGQPDTTSTYIRYLGRLVRQYRFDDFMNKNRWLTCSRGTTGT